MNYIPQIAKMLGVDVGEKFTIHCFQPDVSADAEFADNGLVVFLTDHVSKGNSTWLMDLIQGRAEIVKKQWKPKDGERYYWFTCIHGIMYVADRFFETADGGDIACYRLGNCYRTRKEAEADREKWERFYASEERIDWEGKNGD